MKKFLATFMALAMTLSLTPVAAFAADDIEITGNEVGPNVDVNWEYTPSEDIKPAHREIKIEWSQTDGGLTYIQGDSVKTWDKDAYKWSENNNEAVGNNFTKPTLKVKVTNLSSPGNDLKPSLSIDTNHFTYLWNDSSDVETPAVQVMSWNPTLSSAIGPNGRTSEFEFNFDGIDKDKIVSDITENWEEEYEGTDSAVYSFKASLTFTR